MRPAPNARSLARRLKNFPKRGQFSDPFGALLNEEELRTARIRSLTLPTRKEHPARRRSRRLPAAEGFILDGFTRNSSYT